MLNTGDLEGRRSRDVYRIYERLTEAGGLLPPAIGFIFDREGRDERWRRDLERESDDLVAFTPRRTYENYLLNPSAIAYVASQIEGFREDGTISQEEVERWIEQQRWDNKYFQEPIEPSSRTQSLWLAEVDGAKLLKDLFGDLSENRVAYKKVLHGSLLTRWLCDEKPTELEELASLIKQLLGGRGQESHYNEERRR